jgi:hypothetical protein
MLAKLRLLYLCLVAILAAPNAIAYGQPAAQEERVAASFVLALGRVPSASELEGWTKQGPLSLADLIARHRDQLRADAAGARAVAARAGYDAFGRAPAEEELAGLAGGGIYADLMKRHIQWLAVHPADYEQVLNRAYRLLLRRDTYSIEVEYWRRQPALPFALVAACIEDWARRNQPGLMATTGAAAVSINSACLSTVRLSPGVAAEARMAAGLGRPADAARAAAIGATVIAPGAEEVASVGGIFFAAAGSARLRPGPEQR